MENINRKGFLAGLGAAIAGISLGGSLSKSPKSYEDSDLNKAAFYEDFDFDKAAFYISSSIDKLGVRVNTHLKKGKYLEYGEPFRLVARFSDGSSCLHSNSAYMAGEEWTGNDEVKTFFEYIKKVLLDGRGCEYLINNKSIDVSIEAYQWSSKYVLKCLTGIKIAI